MHVDLYIAIYIPLEYDISPYNDNNSFYICKWRVTLVWQESLTLSRTPGFICFSIWSIFTCNYFYGLIGKLFYVPFWRDEWILFRPFCIMSTFFIYCDIVFVAWKLFPRCLHVCQLFFAQQVSPMSHGRYGCLANVVLSAYLFLLYAQERQFVLHGKNVLFFPMMCTYECSLLPTLSALGFLIVG